MIHLARCTEYPDKSTSNGTPKFQLDYESFDSLLNLAYLKPLHVAGHSHFGSYLALHLPEVAAKISYDDFGILHLEVGVLTLATREAIAHRDWRMVSKYFAEVADMMDYAGSELIDALCVSYLGSLFYGEASLNYEKARSLLPQPLVQALAGVERHYEELVH